MTEKKLLDNILSGGVLMQKAAESFYLENYKLVYNAKGISREEALDAYSDSVTAFVENVRNRLFKGESKSSTYFIRIFNNKCIDVLRKKTTNKSKQITMSIEELKTDLPDIEVTNEEHTDLTAYFNELSDVCREVLMDWSDGYSMDDIAERNGLKNAHTARSKRYNCFQQLMEILQRRNIVAS
jgi:RNA polymerase sigma-70 factor (ECF subfamily)